MARYIPIILALFIGVGVAWALKPSPEPITYTNIRVDTIIGEPDTVRTFVDRIVYREREPELTVVQPEGAEDEVSAFCRPDTVMVVTDADTIWIPADTVYLVRSVVHDPSWFFGKDRITVFGPTSVGDLREMRFTSYPGWSLRTTPETLFREPRFGLLRQIIEAGTYISAGILLGKVVF